MNVRLAINDAVKSESGVTSTTISVTIQLTESMQISVPSMVMTPVKSCVKPIRRPSET